MARLGAKLSEIEKRKEKEKKERKRETEGEFNQGLRGN